MTKITEATMEMTQMMIKVKTMTKSIIKNGEVLGIWGGRAIVDLE